MRGGYAASTRPNMEADRGCLGKERMRYCFGSFELDTLRRELTRDGRPMRLAGRGFDLLACLVERRGETISSEEIVGKVWPDRRMDPSQLRFHIAPLRKALGQSSECRFIAALSGKGYSFIAEVNPKYPDGSEGFHAPSETQARIKALDPDSEREISFWRETELAGRKDEIAAFGRTLLSDRFLTIVGAGGVGKTSLALAIADDLRERFSRGVLVVNVAAIHGLGMISTAMASLQAQRSEGGALLILDGCEQDTIFAAETARRLLASFKDLFVIATSRAPLMTAGERQRRLGMLAVPPAGSSWPRILSYPSVEVLLMRGHLDAGSLSESERIMVADASRRLDGLPLAIEIAAVHCRRGGVEALRNIPEDGIFDLEARHARPDRHRTLRANVDWSYRMLSDEEKDVLRRLSVFAGPFEMDAAFAACARTASERSAFPDRFLSLILKSVMLVDIEGDAKIYRLGNDIRRLSIARSNVP
ncbi:hypothetical protein GR212_31880 [Rhizobium lusitanum]|uniref:OmpR/PhoB-type domain-containing protein n=1 Tax=Rhizobium lusitanum TaxID=293958 RepID=A0A6L9UJV5_9HYPH|nr:hypothetical protein [Rhizobium lusitanum]